MNAPSTVDSTDLQEYWRILVRRRWVVYLSVLTFGLIALVGSFLTTPLFKANRHAAD